MCITWGKLIYFVEPSPWDIIQHLGGYRCYEAVGVMTRSVMAAEKCVALTVSIKSF